jgi:hypothetical protein
VLGEATFGKVQQAKGSNEMTKDESLNKKPFNAKTWSRAGVTPQQDWLVAEG